MAVRKKIQTAKMKWKKEKHDVIQLALKQGSLRERRALPLHPIFFREIRTRYLSTEENSDQFSSKYICS